MTMPMNRQLKQTGLQLQARKMPVSLRLQRKQPPYAPSMTKWAPSPQLKRCTPAAEPHFSPRVPLLRGRCIRIAPVRLFSLPTQAMIASQGMMLLMYATGGACTYRTHQQQSCSAL